MARTAVTERREQFSHFYTAANTKFPFSLVMAGKKPDPLPSGRNDSDVIQPVAAESMKTRKLSASLPHTPCSRACPRKRQSFKGGTTMCYHEQWRL